MLSALRSPLSALRSPLSAIIALAVCLTLSGCATIFKMEFIKKNDQSIELEMWRGDAKMEKVDKHGFFPQRAEYVKTAFIYPGGSTDDIREIVYASLRKACINSGGSYSSKPVDGDSIELAKLSGLVLYRMDASCSFATKDGNSVQRIITILVYTGYTTPKGGVKYDGYMIVQNENDMKATRAAIERHPVYLAEKSAISTWESATDKLRKSLKVGDTVYQLSKPRIAGLVVEVKPPLASVQIQKELQWVKIEELYPEVPMGLRCGVMKSSLRSCIWP